MEALRHSEFADEYQDWLEGSPGARRMPWLDFPVGELDCGPLLKVEPSTSLHTVIMLMNEHHRGAVLVVREQALLGIFTERDVLRRVVTRGLELPRVQVGEVMTPRPDVLPEWATLAQALRVMSVGGYRHLPIVDAHGTPKSMVSMPSIIELVTATFPKEILNAPPEQQRSSLRADGG